MIDASKIRPGDTGTIRVTFYEQDDCGRILVSTGKISARVPASIIASHTPAPWVPEKGDVVGWLVSKLPEWEIRAIDGEDTLIRSQYPNGVVRVEAALLSDLTLIRKGAA